MIVSFISRSFKSLLPYTNHNNLEGFGGHARQVPGSANEFSVRRIRDSAEVDSAQDFAEGRITHRPIMTEHCLQKKRNFLQVFEFNDFPLISGLFSVCSPCHSSSK